jgi:hypothetical protein
LGWSDRRVFDTSDRFRWPGTAREKGESRFSDRPHEVHFRLIAANERAQTEVASRELRQSRGDILVVKFYNQDRLAGFRVQLKEVTRSFETELAFRLIKERPVDVLDRGGFQIEQFDV